MKTKILLINTPTIRDQFVGSDNYFPLGLLYIATVAKNNNMDVRVLDINNYYYNYKKDFTENELYKYIENNLYKYIKDYMPGIIGIGCTFSGAFKSLKIIAKGIKDAFPNIPIVIGGIHPTIFAREILKKYSFIDYVVIGEGEFTFLELVKCIINSKKQAINFIDGIAFRENGDIKLNPKTKFINNLDVLPHIDYSTINVEEYKMDTSGWYSPKKIEIGQPFSIISSRSCPNRCNFCSMWLVHGARPRFRSATNVLDEIEHLYNHYNVRYFEFMDDNMTFDKKRTLEICNGILKRRLNIQFGTPNGLAINRLDKEIIDALVDAGMIWISIAPESGSEYIRIKVMRKPITNEKIYEVVENCARHKHLFIKAFFIIGMPEETHETLEETYKMIKELPFDKIALYFPAPYPGTELFNYCVKYNLLPYKAEDYADVKDLQIKADRPHFKPHKLTIDDLIEFQKKGFDYLRKERISSGLPYNYPLRYKE